MHSQKKILIIDDDPDITFAMEIVLKEKGYTVVKAANGKEGMQTVKHNPPDLIILDVMMSTKDEGFQVAYQLKNNPKTAQIPILMSTSINKESDFTFSKDSDEQWIPVDDMAEKPLLPDDLLLRVAKLLDNNPPG